MRRAHGDRSPPCGGRGTSTSGGWLPPALLGDHWWTRGEVPDAVHPPGGCPFHPRCPHSQERCGAEVPALRVTAEAHLAACHFSERLYGEGWP